MENENILGKRDVKRLPVWACIPLFVVVMYVLMVLYVYVIGKGLQWGFDWDLQHAGLAEDIVKEVCGLLAALTSAFILLYFERRPFSDMGLSVRHGHAKGLWYGLLVAVLFYLVGFSLSLLLGKMEVTGVRFDWCDLLVAWIFFLFVSLTEEVIMRGYILGRLLHTSMNKFLSVFVSAVLFALLHLFNPNLSVVPMLNLMLAGMMLGVSYLYTRNLCFPVSLHLFWNWIQGPVLGYRVSGNAVDSSLLTLHMSEETLLNGGSFGFEGSLICTVLLVVLTITIVWWGEKRLAISLVTKAMD